MDSGSSSSSPARTGSPASVGARGASFGDQLAVSGLTKRFGAVRALEQVSFSVAAGEVVGVVGDNGAGKSTLIRCIAGIHKPDSGTVSVGADVYHALTPDVSQALGLEVVHQQLGLVDELDVVANLFLNREYVSANRLASRLGILARRRMRRETEQALTRFRLDIKNVKRPVRELSGGQRQMLAVIRAVQRSPRFVLMDEPTAALGVPQSQRVHDLVLGLGDQGIGVIVVSHRMDQVMAITTKVVVLRHGKKVAELATAATGAEEVIAYITGALAPQHP